MNKSTVLAFRRHFPAYDRQVFLAHCAQSPLSDGARAAVDALLDDYVTSGGVKFGEHLEVVARARAGVARLLGGDGADVAFIKNTSDGALLAADLLPLQAGDVVLVADCEFPANVIPFDLLASRGVSVCRVPTPDHRPDMARFDEARAGRRGLVALSWVQYARGYRADLRAWGAWCAERGLYLAVDAIQGLGVLDMRAELPACDLVYAGGHKWLMALPGTGLLWANPRVRDRLQPTSRGWMSIVEWHDFRNDTYTVLPSLERLEEGTKNFIGIAALGAAIELLLAAGPEWVERQALACVARLEDGLRAQGHRILTPVDPGDGARRSAILAAAPRDGAVGDWHARLLAAGIGCTLRGEGVRFAPHAANTVDEMARVLEVTRP